MWCDITLHPRQFSRQRGFAVYLRVTDGGHAAVAILRGAKHSRVKILKHAEHSVLVLLRARRNLLPRDILNVIARATYTHTDHGTLQNIARLFPQQHCTFCYFAVFIDPR